MSKKISKLLVLLIVCFTTFCINAHAQPQSIPEPEMVKVSGGTFQMEDTYGPRLRDESSLRKVHIDTFYLAKYAQSEHRNGLWGNDSDDTIGFRLALSDQ